MNLEKAYDAIDRVDSRTCVSVGEDVCKFFPVTVGLKQV